MRHNQSPVVHHQKSLQVNLTLYFHLMGLVNQPAAKLSNTTLISLTFHHFYHKLISKETLKITLLQEKSNNTLHLVFTILPLLSTCNLYQRISPSDCHCPYSEQNYRLVVPKFNVCSHMLMIIWLSQIGFLCILTLSCMLNLREKDTN